MTRHILFTIALMAALPTPAAAVDEHHQSAAAPSVESASLTEGEVRKVDKDAKKITIKHGPIRNLDMPAMTMVFQVADPALLEQVKAGDKIRFLADRAGGAFTVLRVEPVK